MRKAPKGDNPNTDRASGSGGTVLLRDQLTLSVPDLACCWSRCDVAPRDHRGLDTWEKLVAYAAEEWFPSRIAFGKHKGRLFQEARQDTELRRWLAWLAGSSNARSAQMGRWYLRQLELEGTADGDGGGFIARKSQADKNGLEPTDAGLSALVVFVNPELEELRQLVAAARAQLAELEADYTKEKSRVDATQANLFRLLREQYQKRDRLRLIVDYRTKYLNSLVRGGEEEAKQAEEDYAEAKAQSDQDYEETAAAVAEKNELSAEEEEELTRLWKKLVKLYHPDRFAHEPDKLETYHKLTAAINQAKDSGDIKTLREIAEDPHGYILRQGWTSLDFSDEAELAQLRRLHETLQIEIITVLESLNRLRESPEYELCKLSEQRPGMLNELAAERAELLEDECVKLAKEAEKLAEEIRELTGEEGSVIR